MTTYLVGLDRDNTLIHDPGFFGRDANWREQLKILPTVVDGIKLLREDPRIKIIVATNQAGVARGYYPRERVDETNTAVARALKEQGIELDGWYSCNYVGRSYAEEKGVSLDNPFVKDTPLRKPGIGMLQEAARDLGLDWGELVANKRIYFIGDKSSDVETALNANGTGILVPSPESDKERVQMLKEGYGEIYITTNFLHACMLIRKQIPPN